MTELVVAIDPTIKDAIAKGWFGVAGNLLVGIITAYVTVKLAFRRFYSEKKWQRSDDAYSKIFVALHQVRDHAAHELSDLREEDLNPAPMFSEITEKRQTVLNVLESEMQSGIGELRLQIDIGTFAISNKAVALLERLMSSFDEGVVLGKEHGFEHHLVHKIGTIDGCFKELRTIARHDLSKGSKFSKRKESL